MDDDTYFEVLDYHHQRLADVATHLATNNDWDIPNGGEPRAGLCQSFLPESSG